MQEVLLNVLQLVLSSIPTLVGAVLVLLVGWLVALVVSAVVRRVLRRTTVDNRLAGWIRGEEAAEGIEAERWIARGVFWMVMIFVLVAFFQVLGLTLITEPLNQLLIQVFQYAPRLLGGGLLLLVAWIVASILRAGTARALRMAKVEERFDTLAGTEDTERLELSKTLSEAVYWIVLLLFLPAVLGALAVEGLLEPAQGMIDAVLGFLPSLFAAGLILAVGWLVARIVQRIVASLLVSVGADRVSARVGLDQVLGEQRLSNVIGLVLYVLVLIPVLIAALDALALDAVTAPASNMLNAILMALPSVFAAALVLVVAYVVGRLVAGLVTNVLTGLGFNTILARLGLGGGSSEAQWTPAQIAGYLVLVGVMLVASIEASQLLGFQILATLVSELTVFVGQVVLGLVIFGIGLYLANLAAKVILASGAAQSGLLALAARVAILVLAGAIGLSEIGLANEIIQLAFGLLLAALALSAALAFGLGGRDVAGREIEGWLESMRSKE
ncbi:MAG: mechanosensitive ion channel [Anaerolineae bacterium]|nr:mechanosensitive ion channel [Anaerolineae bacterium]